jgi:uncharacterized membrane protein HdeD (DUF308 family)
VFPSWGLALALGILEVIFSFWLIGRPALTLMATVYAIGIWSIVYGVMQIALAIDVKHLPARADAAARDIDAATHRLDRVAS